MGVTSFTSESRRGDSGCQYESLALADAESERLAALTAKAEAEKVKAEEGEKLQAEERKSAEQRAELGRRANYSRLLGVADRFWETGSIALAEDSLDECPSDLRGCEWHFRRRRNNPDGLTFRATSNEVGSLAIQSRRETHPDGERCCIKNLDQPPGTVDVWNTPRPGHAFDMPNPVTRYAAVGGAMMVAGLPPQRHTRPVCSVAFQPGGSTFVSASRGTNVAGVLAMLPAAFSQVNGELLVWDATTRQVRFSIRDAVGPVAFSADGKRFVACSAGRLARVWDVTGTEWKELPALAAYPGSIKAVALSPDSRQLAVAGYHVESLTPGQTQVSYELGVYDITTGQKILTGPKHDGVIECVAFSPDGRTLVAGCEDGVVRQWDLTTGQQGARLRGHKNAVLEVAFNAGGKWLATGSRDQTVRLWDWKEGAELRTFRGHDGPVWTVAFATTETGEMLVSGGGDGVVRTWNPWRDTSVLELTGHQGMINSLALSPDRPLLATVCRREARVRVWNLETGRQVTEPMSAFAGTGGLRSRWAFGNRRGADREFPRSTDPLGCDNRKNQVQPHRTQKICDGDRVQPGRPTPCLGRGRPHERGSGRGESMGYSDRQRVVRVSAASGDGGNAGILAGRQAVGGRRLRPKSGRHLRFGNRKGTSTAGSLSRPRHCGGVFPRRPNAGSGGSLRSSQFPRRG